MKGKLLVIGSSNTDLVINTRDFPKPGETILGDSFLMNPGGKGANQAVAASRLGAEVRFVTKLGNDVFGKAALEGFKKENLDTRFILETDNFPSGVASIIVNGQGENQIIVASGANMDLKPADLPDQIFDGVQLVLLQLEIPLETVRYVIEKCRILDLKVILNPAPAQKLDDSLLRDIFLITPNETETHILTGIMPENEDSLQPAAGYFLTRGIKNVIMTLGKQGVYLSNSRHDRIIPAEKVDAVDTTAAGDVFNGAIATALLDGKEFVEACRYACKASGISVTRIGAQHSAPYQNEMI